MTKRTPGITKRARSMISVRYDYDMTSSGRSPVRSCRTHLDLIPAREPEILPGLGLHRITGNGALADLGAITLWSAWITANCGAHRGQSRRMIRFETAGIRRCLPAMHSQPSESPIRSGLVLRHAPDAEMPSMRSHATQGNSP